MPLIAGMPFMRNGARSPRPNLLKPASATTEPSAHATTAGGETATNLLSSIAGYFLLFTRKKSVMRIAPHGGMNVLRMFSQPQKLS